MRQGTFTELSKSGVDFSELLKLSDDATPEPDGSLSNQDITRSNAHNGPKRPRADSIVSVDSIGKDYIVRFIYDTHVLLIIMAKKFLIWLILLPI